MRVSRTDERSQAAREAVETLIAEYRDVFAARDFDGHEVEMPVLSAWVLVTCHDDAADPSIGACHRLTPRYQWRHESIGLMEMAIHDYYRDADE